MDFPEPVSDASKNCCHRPGVAPTFGDGLTGASGCASSHFRLKD